MGGCFLLFSLHQVAAVNYHPATAAIDYTATLKDLSPFLKGSGCCYNQIANIS